MIVGPTASGKTGLSVALAKKLRGEVISADSMQIYRGMDVGTAKVTPEEMDGVPHHMIDVAEPEENWSVARYVAEASRVCDGLIARGRLPVVVGGTGLYIDSLIAGRDFAENDGDDKLREQLNADYERLGGEAMWEKLRAVDPARASILAPTDRRRIVRALEIRALTGKTITEHDEETRRRPPRYEARRVVLSFADRAALYARIDRRVEQMAGEGLFEEVESLLASGVPADCTAMQAIGYKEAARALRGEISRAEAIALIQQASRRYAKRQLTWFRRAPDALWIEWTGEPDFSAAAEKIRNSEFGVRNQDSIESACGTC